MKKVFVIVLAVLFSMLLAACAMADESVASAYLADEKTVFFGHYPQQYSIMPTDRYNASSAEFLLDPIEWIILEEDGDNVLLLSRTALDYRKFNDKKEKKDWADSTLREWLNSEFIDNAFDENEAGAILETEISTGGDMVDSGWEVPGIRTTKDKVFLLSYPEYEKYIKDDKIPINNYVSNKGAAHLIVKDDDTWWLRTTGKNGEEACFAGNGKIESAWISDTRGIRPLIRIDKSKIDWQDNVYVKVIQAKSLAENGQLPEATAITDRLAEYREPAYLSVLYRVNYAKPAYESGDYAEAIVRYSAAKEYIEEHFTDSTATQGLLLIYGFEIDTKLLESKYNVAIQAKENGETQKAIGMFADIGQYRDSMQNLRECFDREHILYTWLTGSDSAVNTGLDNGYEKTDPIDSKDPHFGWSLGRFMISGYTEAEENDNGPVFIKKPGDSLILWFDLAQDIYALNGDDDLFINNDDNGFDLQFRVAKSDFGKGTLLVRHTDSGSSDPEEAARYKNYLHSNLDSVTDTRVEIQEEGTYQVALDYEIAKKAFLKNKYYNYRIYFTFSVRNADGVIFMSDISTGAELRDYSRTADGFRVDLADSGSLSVHCVRYALNPDKTGLDAVEAGPLPDGAVLEEIGYYEITVTGKDTGEELTNHIFVGRKADLEEYRAADESLKKISD